MKFEGKVN